MIARIFDFTPFPCRHIHRIEPVRKAMVTKTAKNNVPMIGLIIKGTMMMQLCRQNIIAQWSPLVIMPIIPCTCIPAKRRIINFISIQPFLPGIDKTRAQTEFHRTRSSIFFRVGSAVRCIISCYLLVIKIINFLVVNIKHSPRHFIRFKGYFMSPEISIVYHPYRTYHFTDTASLQIVHFISFVFIQGK